MVHGDRLLVGTFEYQAFPFGVDRAFYPLHGIPGVGGLTVYPALAFFLDYGRAWDSDTGRLYPEVRFPRDARLGTGVSLRLIMDSPWLEMIRIDVGVSEESSKEEMPLVLHLGVTGYI